MPAPKNQQTVVFLLAAFGLGIFSLLAIWAILMLPSFDGGSSGGGEHPPPVVGGGGSSGGSSSGASGGTSSPSGAKTEVELARERAHELVHVTAKDLLKNEAISFDEVFRLRKDLESADDAYAARRYPEALQSYRKIEEDLRDEMEAKKLLDEANRLAVDLLKRLKQLEKFRKVVPAAYEVALNASDDGAQKIQSGDYRGAAKSFEGGLKKLEEVERVGSDLLNRSLEKAKAALAKLDVVTAETEVKKVLGWQADHPEALQLLEQVAELKNVVAELVFAEKELQAKRYERAIGGFKRVLEKRPTMERAKKGLAAAEAGWKAQLEASEKAKREALMARLKPLIAEAQKLFEAKKYEASLSKLREAQKLAPEEKSIAAAIREVEAAMSQTGVEGKLKKAYAHFQKQEWKEARRLYDEVLKEDPGNAEAKKGSDESFRRMTAQIRYDSLMGLARKHARDGRYPRALKLFNEAMGAKPDHLKLTKEDEALRKELEVQSQPVTLRVRSDRRTWVSIIGVLPPEQFGERVLTVYPDVYSVRGKRTGYRDVSMEVPIRAGKGVVDLTVKCTR